MIICLKLIDGSELVGVIEAIPEKGEDFNIETPAYIIEVRTNTTVGVRLSPFMFHSDNSLFTFKDKHVITYCNPTANLAEYYEKTFLSTEDEEPAFISPPKSQLN